MEVFVSYAHPDTPIARAVAKGLTDEGHTVALVDEIVPGDNWALRIGEALERSRALVVLLSPEAVKSDHVRREIEFALTSPQFAHRIFPVMIRPTQGVPWILRTLNMLVTGPNPEDVRAAVVDALRETLRKRDVAIAPRSPDEEIAKAAPGSVPLPCCSRPQVCHQTLQALEASPSSGLVQP